MAADMSIADMMRKLAAPASIAAALAAAMQPQPARAQPYLGWDFGGGFGIGIGTPPSAYMRCPDYGWGPFYPYRCRYAPPRVRHHAVAPRRAWTAPPG
jgi:hypothetical protein